MLQKINGEIIVSSNSAVGFQECRNEIYVYDMGTDDIETYKIHELPTSLTTTASEEIVLHELYTRLLEATRIRHDTIHPLKPQ